MKNIKVVSIGDASSGKTELLIQFLKDNGETNIPTIFDNYNLNFMAPNYPPIMINLWDTSGQENYNKLRALTYPQTDVFLLCFSLVDPLTLRHIEEIFVPEIHQFCPNSILILVGTKQELREHFDPNKDENRANNLEPISPRTAERVAKHIGANRYMEVSVASGKNTKELLNEVIRILFQKKK